ncbi:MAG: YicC/YloC family endoribonuclease [Tissierellia bacterium]|nr:YicC/YloC family endoribonuclease [Tissierellia bacterium]
MLSMTGYGQAEISRGSYRVNIQMRSVNHKYLDIRIHSNDKSVKLSQEIEAQIKDRIHRGHLELKVQINKEEETQKKFLNEEVFSGYLSIYKKGLDLAGEDLPLDMAWILRQEGVIETLEEEDEDLLLGLVKETLSQALDDLVAMRKVEGKKLEEDMRGVLEDLKKRTDQVARLSDQGMDEKKDLLHQRIEGLISEYGVDAQRLATEMAILVDKLSIDEEIVRMASHIQQFHGIMALEKPKGRKLDFLLQEMNREANTMGSKAQDIAILHLIVDMKADIEKIREQVQNIE